ncbi:MAG: hypothetical protein K2F88_03640 [Duncaniella sp.]|nr:hypothetical protein [Duncaniella sp.]
MIKHLLSCAAISIIAFGAKAEKTVSTLWESAEPVTITWGAPSCEISAAKCEDFKDGEILGFTVAEKTDDDAWPQFTICGSDADWKWIDLHNIGVWNETSFPVVMEYEMTEDFVEKAKVHGIFLKGTAVKISKITLTAETGPTVPTTEKTLSLDGNNLLLSQFVELPDDTEIIVTLSISNKDSNVAAGWGVGAIHPISDYSTTRYGFNAKEVSEEGALNTYKFTAVQFKEWAKENGEYITDQYNQQGLSFNVYNGATIVSIVAKIKNDPSGIADIVLDNENAPVEFFNLQGVRVENPSNGLYIRRQGNKVSKVIIR